MIIRKKAIPLLRAALICAAAAALAACTESTIPKDIRPVSTKLVGDMAAKGMTETSPILVRIFKEESELEVWKRKSDGKYALLKTYEICKWSGVLGPKMKEGDRQAPEGFYTVTPAQMNPNSSYYLSFNIGYPNAFDRALGRTGTHIMVHGACSSAGCYSMTDADAGEIFALARDAFKGGQREFQIQAFPFRMTPENLARHRNDANMEFWLNLKEGYDHFEVTRVVPKVDVCNKRYVFNAESSRGFSAAGACPAYTVPEPIAAAVAAKQASDQARIASASNKLESDAQALALQQQKLANARASEAAEAAADAARPPLLQRVFKGKKGDQEPVEPETATAAVEVVAPAAKPVAAAAPAPAPAPASKPAAAPAVAASPPPEAVDATTTATAVTDAPVRRLSSDFDWPEDDATVAGGGKFLPSGLDAPPPTAN